MTRSDKNGQQKTRTLHVAVPAELLKRIRTLAQWDKRSLNAQAVWLMEKGLLHLERQGYGEREVR